MIDKTATGTTFRLYRSQNDRGTYQGATPLPFSDGTQGDVDPEIAPDESFLVFSSSGRRVPPDSHEHLFIVHKQGADWGPVTPLQYAGDDASGIDDNEARLSPDQHTLYFSSNRSIPVTFPRSREQAQRDVARLTLWDNGHGNVWMLPLAGLTANR